MSRDPDMRETAEQLLLWAALIAIAVTVWRIVEVLQEMLG